ncbi:MAG: ABC transporter permease [Verrucomicrobiota bacterium]|nr:ABC transporter permease [Verrucomicrobiota bacterium]
MITDIRYAIRQLIKHPGFTLIAIFALALGIGANTAIFSVVNAVLLRPLPYPDSDQLVQLRERSNSFDAGSVCYPNWIDWRAAQRSFTDIALIRREGFNFSGTGGTGAPERLQGLRASSNFLSVLGLNQQIGRNLTPGDDVAGAPDVALISNKLWQERFAGSPTALGQRVTIDGLPRQIIGVLPSDLRYGRNPDVLLPLSEVLKDPNMQNRGNHPGFVGLARLKRGVTIDQAQSDLQAIALDLEAKYPDTNTGRRVNMRPLFEATVGDYRASLNLLLEISIVSPDYFRLMGMPILRGRGFSADDIAGRPRSVVIDETFAQKFFAGKDPIGQHIDDNQSDEKNPPPLTVIGVVPRTRNEAPGEDNSEKLQWVQMYFSGTQHPEPNNTLLIRTSATDVGPLVTAVKREMKALDPDQPLGVVSTMEKNVASSLATRRLMMALLAAFAVLALLLASVGLYGVMALTVTQRTREMGIRMALGAARTSIFRLVLAHGMSLIAIGVVVGLVGAVAVRRALTSLLYGVGALDLGAAAAAVVSLSIIAVIACCVPARRATRVDPIVALREE